MALSRLARVCLRSRRPSSRSPPFRGLPYRLRELLRQLRVGRPPSSERFRRRIGRRLLDPWCRRFGGATASRSQFKLRQRRLAHPWTPWRLLRWHWTSARSPTCTRPRPWSGDDPSPLSSGRPESLSERHCRKRKTTTGTSLPPPLARPRCPGAPLLHKRDPVIRAESPTTRRSAACPTLHPTRRFFPHPQLHPQLHPQRHPLLRFLSHLGALRVPIQVLLVQACERSCRLSLAWASPWRLQAARGRPRSPATSCA